MKARKENRREVRQMQKDKLTVKQNGEIERKTKKKMRIIKEANGRKEEIEKEKEEGDKTGEEDE